MRYWEGPADAGGRLLARCFLYAARRRCADRCGSGARGATGRAGVRRDDLPGRQDRGASSAGDGRLFGPLQYHASGGRRVRHRSHAAGLRDVPFAAGRTGGRRDRSPGPPDASRPYRPRGAGGSGGQVCGPHGQATLAAVRPYTGELGPALDRPGSDREDAFRRHQDRRRHPVAGDSRRLGPFRRRTYGAALRDHTARANGPGRRPMRDHAA